MPSFFDPADLTDVIVLVLLTGALSLVLLGGIWMALRTAHRNRKLHEEVRRMRNKLRQNAKAAELDPLTGSMNRKRLERQFRDDAPKALRNGVSIVVCSLNLDGFKIVNERWGHATGDELLARIGKRLWRGVRHGDAVARLGGDEFVVLLNSIADPEDCTRAVQKLLNAVASPMYLPGLDIRVQITASVGMALFPVHGEALPLLLERAGLALRQAKRAGKGRYQLFTPETASAYSRIERGSASRIGIKRARTRKKPALPLSGTR